jgi:O-antigen ligase
MLAASLLANEVYLWWTGVALLWGVFLVAPGRLPANALSISLCLFCVWLFADAAFFTPHYVFTGLYRPAVLFGGFAAAAVLDRQTLARLAHAGAIVAMLLVLVGFMQLFFGFWHFEKNMDRAAATFVTPNTFAAVINLFLLPMLAVAASGRGGWKIYLGSLWLFAGLLSTESRGGWVAFLAGVVVIAAYHGIPKSRDARMRWLQILAGLVLMVIGYYMLKAVPHASSGGVLAGGAGMAVESIVSRGPAERIELIGMTLGQIAQHPFAGAGANMFSPLYEMTKPFDNNLNFPFAHNDYLQTWLEFGLPGIVLLGMIMAAALATILKGRRLDRNDPIPLVCSAAAAGFFAHAAVDFPLYVPFPLVVMGMWLGALSGRGGDARWAATARAYITNRLPSSRMSLTRGTLAVVGLAWLAQPAIADVAARRALAELRSGRAENGLYWQSVSRRLEPRSAQRYWEEGVIWRDQAVASGNKLLAMKADRTFAEGVRVDPFDINNLLERVRLRRQYPQLLEQPASSDEILGWSAQALKIAPYMIATQVEYARTLAFVGRKDEARQVARTLLERHHGLQIALRLAAEI